MRNMKDIMENVEIRDDEEIVKMDYFSSFMKDVIRDLKKKGKSFVFNQEQVDFIKGRYPQIKARENDGIIYLSLI